MNYFQGQLWIGCRHRTTAKPAGSGFFDKGQTVGLVRQPCSSSFRIGQLGRSSPAQAWTRWDSVLRMADSSSILRSRSDIMRCKRLESVRPCVRRMLLFFVYVKQPFSYLPLPFAAPLTVMTLPAEIVHVLLEAVGAPRQAPSWPTGGSQVPLLRVTASSPIHSTHDSDILKLPENVTFR